MGVTWYFKGEILKNSSKVQIKVREDSSTLTIIDCSFDDGGMYECRAANSLGTDKTKGSLTVNKMTEQEKQEYEKLKASGLLDAVADEEKKVEKKEEAKKTYDWKKGVKKVEKKVPDEPMIPEKVVLKKPKVVDKPKEDQKDGIKLKPVPPKEKDEPEKKEGVKLKPVPPKEKEEKPKTASLNISKVRPVKTSEISEEPKCIENKPSLKHNSSSVAADEIKLDVIRSNEIPMKTEASEEIGEIDGTLTKDLGSKYVQSCGIEESLQDNTYIEKPSVKREEENAVDMPDLEIKINPFKSEKEIPEKKESIINEFPGDD